ncbi:MAG: TIGR03792 family protein [Pseudomonadota bacterium]
MSGWGLIDTFGCARTGMSVHGDMRAFWKGVSMVVERLTFQVVKADHAAWLEADARSWTPFLAAQDGFVSKQVWAQRDRPDELQAVILWESEAQWKAIPTVELEATEALMGDMKRPLVCHTFDVLASSGPRQAG